MKIEIREQGSWRRFKEGSEQYHARAFLFNRARYSIVIKYDLGPPESEPLFDAFLSYRFDDEELAYNLAEDLRKKGVVLWFDKWHIPVRRTMPLEYYIRHGIKRSAMFLRLTEDVTESYVNERDRWFWFETELSSYGMPWSALVYPPSTLVDLECGEMSSLVQTLKGLASYDTIAARKWLDEDPAIYDWEEVKKRRTSARTRLSRD